MIGHTTTPVLKESNTATIRENDVLLGRGGQTNKHVGNKRFRSIVVDHQGEYLNARKKDKVLIARKIVAIIRQNGGRFLKQGIFAQWEEVTDERAQAKTSQALREGLDVRYQTQKNSKTTRTDSESGSVDSRPRKKTKINSAGEPRVPNFQSLATLAGYAADPQLGEHQELPKPISFISYQRQVSKSDVTDACSV